MTGSTCRHRIYRLAGTGALMSVLVFGLHTPLIAQTRPANPDNQTGPLPLPTMADLHQMYDDGDYRTCLQQVARVMRLKPSALRTYDLDQLKLLRGLCLLGLEDARSARRVLQDAAKSTQQEVSLPARGLLTLLSRSKGTVYTPRHGDATPLNIADPKQRKDALMALLDDEIDGIQAEAAKAVAANNLAPTIALVPRLVDLHAAEQLATGQSTRTGPIAKTLGEHARDLITRELDVQDRRITGIEQLANQLTSTGGYGGHTGWWTSGVTRRGLVSDEREDLYELIQYLGKIQETAEGALKIARTMNGDVDAWEPIVTRATEVKAHAQAILDAEGIRTANDSSGGR